MSHSHVTDDSGPHFNGGLRTMVRAHIFYGIAGLGVGLATALVLVNIGPEFMQASPLFTVIALGLVFGIGVSMMGGLLHLTGTPEPAAFDDGTASREP